MHKHTRTLLLALLCLLVPMTLLASGGSEPAQQAAPAQAVMEEDFDLNELIAAAQAEGELTVYDTSSRIGGVAEAFSAKYGIPVVNATKMGNPEQVERLRREVDSGNIQVDVIGISDSPTLLNDLIPRGYVINWVPPDMADLLPKEFQLPLVYRMEQRVIGYNTDSYPESPISNIWELTEPRWRSKVMLRDPVATPSTMGFFVTMTTPKYADMLEKAYEDLYGEPLKTNLENAGWEWLDRFSKNDPIVFASDDDVAEAVGAAGQTNAPIGFYVYSKHRNMEEENLKLAVAFDVEPFIGYVGVTCSAIVNGGPHPNAAKLFVRYLQTEEGSAPWVINSMGGYAPNPEIGVYPDDELGSWAAWQPYLVQLDDQLTWEIGQDILDLWLTNAQ